MATNAVGLIDTLLDEYHTIPERFYAVVKNDELAMVVGFPSEDGHGKPLVLRGKELKRTLASMPAEDGEFLRREVRYRLCGLDPFFAYTR